MTNGIPSMNACGCLDQLQVWKLLQCGGQLVCPEGLNGSPSKLCCLTLRSYHSGIWPPWINLPLIEVDLNGMELEAPPEQKIHSAWRGWTQPSVIQWPPLCRHPHMQSHQKTSLALHKSVTHHPCLTCQEVWRWPASPPTPQFQAPSRADPANLTDEVLQLQGGWMQPWSGCSQLRPPWTPPKGAGAKSWYCHAPKWGLGYQGHQRGGGQCATMIKEAEACQVIHACTLEKSHKESIIELELDVIAEEGWDCKAFLETCGPVHPKPMGTNISLAAPYWQCATICHLGDAA